MSFLFQHKEQGAQTRRPSFGQSLVAFFIENIRQALFTLGELWRAPVASLMTIGVLGLSITLPSTLYILVKNTEQIGAGWEQASEISVFIKGDQTQVHIDQLLTRLQVWPEVEQVTYISSTQALEEFRSLSGFGDALSHLSSNPLPNVLLVRPTKKHSTPISAQRLLDKLSEQREVDFGKLDIEWLEKLHAMINIAQEVITMIAVLLFLAVVLIIGNTIRLNILNRREEIMIMKLVGATDGFIQRPFLYTGFWYGFLGGIIAWFADSILLWWLENSIQSLTNLYNQSFDLQGLDLSAVMIMLSFSVGLGLVGSLISVTRHIQEIEPE
jgi:cell division transport system permease protein